MKTRFLKITVADVAKEALRGAPDSPDLDPEELAALDSPIVEKVEDKWQIVDGFHRIAGVAGFLLGEKIDLNSIKIEVLDVTGYDEDVVAAAAVPEGFEDLSQEDAIEELYEAAG